MPSPVERAQELLSSYADLTALAGVAAWRTEAEATVTRLAAASEFANAQASALGLQAADLREAAKRESFLGHFIKSASEKANQSAQRSEWEVAKACRSFAEQLQEKIDITPSAKADRTLLLQEARTRKKELQFQKRELNARMKNIRAEARRESANAATSLTTLLVGSKYAAAERRDIRYAKENALKPHEDTRASIERQLLAIDREILRIESFR